MHERAARGPRGVAVIRSWPVGLRCARSTGAETSVRSVIVVMPAESSEKPPSDPLPQQGGSASKHGPPRNIYGHRLRA